MLGYRFHERIIINNKEGPFRNMIQVQALCIPGFRVYGVVLGCIGFRVEGLGFRIYGSHVLIWSPRSWFWAWFSGNRGLGPLRFRI